MDCQEVQLSIVESFVEPLASDHRRAMEDHIGTCGTCGRFAATQRMLDARLAAAFPTAHLSLTFRTDLKNRLRRDPESTWPDFLPDLAHLGGCALATMLAAVLLPRYTAIVMLAGTAFTGVTLFLQAVIRSSFGEIE
jgi:hypothetical protein